MRKVYLLCLSICFIFIANRSNAQIQITFYTTMGNFVAQLEETKTPITTANFIKLVNQKFFDGIIFHRVAKNFVIQGGDPTGTGFGGPGYTIADEFDSMSNVQKTLGMANEGTPHSGGSQFYINLVNNIFLDHKYSVFGKVITNFTVVQNIGKVAVDTKERPLTNVVMDSVRVTPPVSGIAENGNRFSFINIFPNPITAESAVSISVQAGTKVEVSVYNQWGERITVNTNQLKEGVNHISFKELESKNFSQGIYYLVITNGDSLTKQKFIVL